MKKWLFNPFVYLAGMRALLIGWGIMIVSGFVAFYSGYHFDGALDVHSTGTPTHLLQIFLELVTAWACLVLPLYVLGRIFSDTSVRFIDIAGTIALARWPMVFIVLLGLLPIPELSGAKPSMDDIMKMVSDPYFIAMAVVSLPLIVWVFALHYNAYSVSTNLKGAKAIWTFITGIIIAEIISKIIFTYAFNH